MNSTASDAADAAAATGILAFLGIIWLVMIVVIILVIAGLWKVFVKAGKPGWAAIVPIYNIYILLEIVGRPTWWLALLLLAFIPVIGSLCVLAVMFIIYWDLAKSFGKELGYAIGLVLLSPIFVPMLGFGSAQYLGPMASGFGLPDKPGGGYGAPGAPGGPAGGGYVPPAPSYTPPAPTYTPPTPSYTPPAPTAPSYTPPAPTYTPPAPPAPPAPSAPPAPPTPPGPPTA